MLAMKRWGVSARHTIMPPSAADVEARVRQRLFSDCPYGFYFKDVTCHYASGQLTLRGRIPTFALKRSLQSLLHGLDQVSLINDEVDVVNSYGLSSTRPKWSPTL